MEKISRERPYQGKSVAVCGGAPASVACVVMLTCWSRRIFTSTFSSQDEYSVLRHVFMHSDKLRGPCEGDNVSKKVTTSPARMKTSRKRQMFFFFQLMLKGTQEPL